MTRKLGAYEEKITQLTDHKSKLQEDLESTRNSSVDVNSELAKLNKDLREKQAAFESFQAEADTSKLNLQRRVDEIERQNQLLDQQVSKLNNELQVLQNLKIESENTLNQELHNIKQSSDGEKLELTSELNRVRSTFETEKIHLVREKQQLQENLDNLRDESEGKIRDLEATLKNIQDELENAKNNSKQSESSLSGLIGEMKKKEAKLSEELEEKRNHVDGLNKSLEQLEVSKENLKKEYEEKLDLHQNKISKLEEDIVNVKKQQELATAGTEERVKILDDIQQNCIKQEQMINDLTHQLENEREIKKKLELGVTDSQTKFRELEDEQVDLVNREQNLKLEKEKLTQQLEQLNQFYKALDDKFALEKKDSESFKIVADERVKLMEQKVNELHQLIDGKDRENGIVVEKLHLREEEIVQLQASIKGLELRLEAELGDTQKLLKGKDEELLKAVRDCSTKDNLIADLQTNLENFKACLNSTNNEKESTTELVQKLNQEVAIRDSDIRELKMKIYSVEKMNKDIEDQMKNIVCSKEATITESQMRIVDLMEQVQLLDQVKEKEVFELSTKLYLVQEQLQMHESTANLSTSNLDVSLKRESELKNKIKDLELHETELLLLNQGLKREISELESKKGVPRTGDAYDQELQNHIEFLNSIIADMHKTNLELSQKVEVLSSGQAGAS